MQDKAKLALGLARKAGALETGTEPCREAARRKRACLILSASDISDNTKKRLKDCGEHYGVEYIDSSMTMDELSSAIGIKRLASAVAVTDKGLANLIKKAIYGGM